MDTMFPLCEPQFQLKVPSKDTVGSALIVTGKLNASRAKVLEF